NPILAMDLDPVDRGIDPAAVRVAHDDDRAGADIAAAIERVPVRRRELFQVAAGVLEHRHLFRGHRRQQLEGLALRHPGLERVERPQRRVEPERQRGALRARGGVGEHPVTRRVALDAIEQKGRALRHPGSNLGDPAKLKVRIGAGDVAQRAEFLDLDNEVAQVSVGHVRPRWIFDNGLVCTTVIDRLSTIKGPRRNQATGAGLMGVSQGRSGSAGSAGKGGAPLRTGAEYLRSLQDGRQVFIDGEPVTDVVRHPAFREAARSIARLYDIAAAPEHRERMTFPSPKTGSPVLRAYQIPRTHADLRARRLFSETWAEATFGLMGRTPDHVAGFFCGY